MSASQEERAMRRLIEPELRRRWPSARIVHELPLRYSERRIDMAAIGPDELVVVEIKSSRDVASRLESQLREFRRVSHRTIVALAPCHAIVGCSATGALRKRDRIAAEMHAAIRATRDFWTMVWRVDAEVGHVDTSDHFETARLRMPDSAALLHMLHVAELRDIAARHLIGSGPRPTHDQLVRACFGAMVGREIIVAALRALRARNAFAADPPSDPPCRIDPAQSEMFDEDAA